MLFLGVHGEQDRGVKRAGIKLPCAAALLLAVVVHAGFASAMKHMVLIKNVGEPLRGCDVTLEDAARAPSSRT